MGWQKGKVLSEVLKFLKLSVKTGISRPEVFCKNFCLKNFKNFTGKHLCRSLTFSCYWGYKNSDKTINQEVMSTSSPGDLSSCDVWFFKGCSNSKKVINDCCILLRISEYRHYSSRRDIKARGSLVTT